MKIAIYARVSTRLQHNENQLEKLMEYANRQKDWTCTVFEEKESTRKTRPEKEKLLKLLREKVFDAVLVYKLDRWGRTMTELVNEMDEFIEKDIGFISMMDNIDLTTSSGKMHFRMLAVFAQFERDLTRDRILDSRDRIKNTPEYKNGTKKFGRPVGSKDTKIRRKSGYLLRWANGGK